MCNFVVASAGDSVVVTSGGPTATEVFPSAELFGTEENLDL
jgi:hypothetical protein